jgi:hypothetical protein
MLEKRFYAVPPQLLIADGQINGRIEVADSRLFKVKQLVTIMAPSLQPLELEVKRVDSLNIMFLGPVGGSIDLRTDLSVYSTISGSFIFADEQQRPKVPEQEIERHTYAESPIVARRVIQVDEMGNPYSDTNPMPVEGTLSVVIGGLSNPIIMNTPAPALTEYLLQLPSQTQEFMIKMRSSCGYKLAWASGGTLVNYISLPVGTVYKQSNLKLNSILNVYIMPTVAGSVIETQYWT